MSNLSTFIREHAEDILLEWEKFARTLMPNEMTNVATLRDHAQAMLDAIATDLDTPQSAREQFRKAQGLEAVDRRRTVSAAAEHGSGRAASGFTVVQMVAEFRALRASVIHLWTARHGGVGPDELEDLIRFNEAIDQAVAESLSRYSSEIDETRERFLAILGHDLRNPIGAITTSTRFLLETGGSAAEQADLIHGIDSAARRMNRLVADLLELALSRLGDRLPIRRTPANLNAMILEVAAEVNASYPEARIETRLEGELSGHWDSARLAQALTNLLGNAVQHGGTALPITISATSDAGEGDVLIKIHNGGPTIPPEKLEHIFDGLRHDLPLNRDRRHLGLGLFIVDQIVEAHGGAIDVRSTDEAGTTFTVRLPRMAGPS